MAVCQAGRLIERFGENDLGVFCSAGAELEFRPPRQVPIQAVAVVNYQVEHLRRAQYAVKSQVTGL